MTIQHKTFTAELVSKSDAGGRIVISTAGCDRDRDRVMPRGAVLDNYQKNPVVMWGHSYYQPSDVIGRTVNLETTDGGIMADFELRPAANDQDPQNIVRLLWDGGWVRTASIGFRPIEMQPNEFGGNDITAWELLEWSLVPIPANADALRLAAKALDAAPEPDNLIHIVAEFAVNATKEADPPAAEGKADEAAVTDTGNDSQDVAPHSTPDADAIDAAQELRLAAILADFVSAVRPYLSE
jgi:HK97 family phage prohead protease